MTLHDANSRFVEFLVEYSRFLLSSKISKQKEKLNKPIGPSMTLPSNSHLSGKTKKNNHGAELLPQLKSSATAMRGPREGRCQHPNWRCLCCSRPSSKPPHRCCQSSSRSTRNSPTTSRHQRNCCCPPPLLQIADNAAATANARLKQRRFTATRLQGTPEQHLP